MNVHTLKNRLAEGLVIPACPLPLDANRNWSPRHQTALTRYYQSAGAGGLAVGVHSTQFAIRAPEHNLYRPVLETVARALDEAEQESDRQLVRIAGICGLTNQATEEAEMARDLGYHTGLLSMTAYNDRPEEELLWHCEQISRIIPIFGFYLQPSVGGKVFGYPFWRRFLEIENVVAIKAAPFNRYQTIEVNRAVIESQRNDVGLYTGNDDNIVLDLLTPFVGFVEGQRTTRFFDGGLLGQWGVWTSKAVDLLARIKSARKDTDLASSLLTENQDLTDANAAVFDAANGFSGCIPGILEVHRRVGLAPSNLCLDPQEVLSAGQMQEIDRVTKRYPELTDDAFVSQHLSQWLD